MRIIDADELLKGRTDHEMISTHLIFNAPTVDVLDKIRDEITDCLKALDEIEKSGFNIYLPNEMSGRRLTYQQCLEFIDKYR